MRAGQVGAVVQDVLPGDPMDPATRLGPLSTERALATFLKRLKQIKQAVADGATLVSGMGIQEFANKKLVGVQRIDVPA